MTMPLVINLGLPKSGTTTLASALSSAGLACADHKMRRSDPGVKDLGGTPIAQALYEGYFKQGDPLAFLGMYDALTEISILRPNLSLWPQTDYGLLSTLRARHPEAKFILTQRPADKIADSMIRWRNLGTQRMPKGAIPGLPAGYGSTRDELVQFIAGHHAFVEQVFGEDPGTLILNMAGTEAQQRLARFLGRDVPWWGRANVNTSSGPA